MYSHRLYSHGNDYHSIRTAIVSRAAHLLLRALRLGPFPLRRLRLAPSERLPQLGLLRCETYTLRLQLRSMLGLGLLQRAAPPRTLPLPLGAIPVARSLQLSPQPLELLG